MSIVTPIKIALVHDWLLHFRGGERVLEAIAEIYPTADIFTLFYDPEKIPESLKSHAVHVSSLNKIAGAKRFYRYLLPFFPLVIERMDLRAYDLVISSSHCVAKGIIPGPKSKHLCYCHTPMRYAWDQSREYFGVKGKSLVVHPFLHYLRLWDVTSSHRVDRFVANSHWVAARIEKYYRRESAVINPFADLDRFTLSESQTREYYLIVSALVPYKRIELAIAACEKLGRKLLIVGEGPEKNYLKSMARQQTQFVGRVAPEDLNHYYGRARALLFPGEEDFGIVPLEAMACGTPVIALGRAGVLDSVVDGKTGVFYSEPNEEALMKSITIFEKGYFSPMECRKRAEIFSKINFQRQLMAEVNSLLEI